MSPARSRGLNILHAIHDFLPRHRAGSELYAFHLAREQQRHHRVHVLCAEYDPSLPHGSVRTRMYEGLFVHELINNWAFGSFEETYRSPALATALEGVLDEVRPDVLHIHNLLNLSFDLPALARARGTPSVATLHDFTLLCPSGGQRVHLAEEHVCHRIDPGRCRRCFAQSPFHSQMAFGKLPASPSVMGPLARVGQVARQTAPRATALAEALLRRAATTPLRTRDISRRLEDVKQVFRDVELFVAPSRAIADELIRHGAPAHKLEISDYGFPSRTPPSTRAPDKKLRFGFVGTLAWHKGAHVLVEAMRSVPPDRASLEIHGELSTFPAYVQRLRALASGLPVTFAGGFREEDAAKIYDSLDVLVVPSLWLENSPLVIHEAFQAGLPIIGARNGGIPGLVQHEVNGLLYDGDGTSASSLSAAMRRLIHDSGLLQKLREQHTPVKSISEDCSEWDERYARVTHQSQQRAAGGRA